MSCGLYLLSLTLVGGRVRDMKDADHLKMLGIEVDDVRFNRQAIADHAANLASTIRGNLTRSMESMGVDILIGNGKLMDAHTVSYGYPGKPGGKCTAANVIIATGSTPFVPPGIEIDNKARPHIYFAVFEGTSNGSQRSSNRKIRVNRRSDLPYNGTIWRFSSLTQELATTI